jgi:cyclic pyranopterin phosphate synthase
VIRGVNDDEVLDLAKLSINNPFHIRFIEFMPIGNNKLWQDRHYVSCTEMKEIITAYQPLIPSASPGPHHSPAENGPARMFEFKGAPGKIGFISPMSNHFCSTCNRIRLTADGKLRSCLFSNQEIDIKDAIRSGGSDDDLKRIFIKSIENKPVGLDPDLFSSLKCNRFMNSIGG